jgi:hypothetical protein
VDEDEITLVRLALSVLDRAGAARIFPIALYFVRLGRPAIEGQVAGSRTLTLRARQVTQPPMRFGTPTMLGHLKPDTVGSMSK